MRSLALFAPTFTRVQEMLQSVQRIKTGPFKHTVKRRLLEISSRAFLVANSIERNVTEIQSPLVQSQLASLQQFLLNRDLSISYDYKRKGFRMEPRTQSPFSHAKLHLRSCVVEKMSSPNIRGSLYFHQLKDLETYFKVDYPKNCPKFVKDIYRKNAENQLLDLKNPLGVPVDAPMLLFLLNFKDKFLVEYSVKYGNINIRTVRLLNEDINADGERKCKYVLSGMSIPRQIQKVVNDYVKEELMLDQPQFLRLHRLSYIGGRIQELEEMLHLYEFFRTNIDTIHT